MSAFEITAEPTAVERFLTIRERVEKLVDYMTTSGKRPAHVQVFASDYNALSATINKRLRREAKAKEKAENEQRRAAKIKDKAKVTPDRVEQLLVRGIPLQPHGYSRHRKVEA